MWAAGRLAQYPLRLLRWTRSGRCAIGRRPASCRPVKADAGPAPPQQLPAKALAERGCDTQRDSGDAVSQERTTTV